MKKKIYTLLLVLALLVLSITLSACSKSPKALQAPENVAVERRVLVWDSVENATGYVVYINGVEYQTNECRLDLHELTVEGGVFDIDVIASGDQKRHLDSLGMRLTVTLDAPPESGTDEQGFAYTYCEDLMGYEISAGTADLTGTVVIPDYFCDYPVKKLAKYALNPYWPVYQVSTTPNYKDYYPSSNKGVNSVTTAVILPAHLERVEQWAFYKVVNLTEIVIPDSVTYMGPSTFANCRNLTSAVLPKNLTVIPGNCFENCPLYEITIPETVVEIQMGAFAYYYEFGSGPEQHRSLLPSSVTIPAGVQVIGAEAFAGQRNLETIIFEDSTNLKSVGYDVFAQTTWYEAQPEGILYLDTLLYGCKESFAGATIYIAASTTVIAAKAFGMNYSELHRNPTKIIFTAPIKEIPEWAFAQCPSVTELVLPAGLETLASGAFLKCESLTHCYFGGTKGEFEELTKNLQYTKETILRDEIMYYYSETEPSEQGNYWHYVDGEATPWFE